MFLLSIEDSFDDFIVSKGKATLAEQTKAKEAQRKKENEKRFNDDMKRLRDESKGKEEEEKPKQATKPKAQLRSSAPAKAAVGGRYVPFFYFFFFFFIFIFVCCLEWPFERLLLRVKVTFERRQRKICCVRHLQEREKSKNLPWQPTLFTERRLPLRG
jgi:hypothetical protein